MSNVWMDEKIHDKTWIKKKIKAKKAQSRPDIHIGKKGVTQQVLNEIENRLKREGVVKIRILRSAIETTGMDRRELARFVAEKLGVRLVEVRGRTFILAKES